MLIGGLVSARLKSYSTIKGSESTYLCVSEDTCFQGELRRL